MPRYPTRPRSTIRVSTSVSDCHDGSPGAHTWTGDPLYAKGNYHYAVSSQEDPACVVEPGTPEDAGKVVRPFHSASSSILRLSR